MFHVELKQFPNVARAFNLGRDELLTRLVRPWVAGATVQWDERRWDPAKARIAIYEGRALQPEEIGLGRGWANATRTGREVTAQLLDEARTPPALEAFKAEIAAQGDVALDALVELAAARHPQSRVSERIALAEQAVWQLLHEGVLQLSRRGDRVPREQWEPLLLSWEAWRDGELRLTER